MRRSLHIVLLLMLPAVVGCIHNPYSGRTELDDWWISRKVFGMKVDDTPRGRQERHMKMMRDAAEDRLEERNAQKETVVIPDNLSF